MLEMSAQHDLLARLERLAQERHTDRDTLLSEAIALYLKREETSQVWTANTSTGEPKEVINLPPPPPVAHIRSPRLVNRQDAEYFRKTIVED